MTQTERDMRPGWVKARDAGRELNWQQRLAERTNGVARIPNLMTTAGIAANAVGVVLALRKQYAVATAVIAGSFALDAEGSVARKFGVEDPGFGAEFDKKADSIKAIMTVGGLVASGTLPLPAAAIAYAPKAANKIVADHANEPLVSSPVAKTAEALRDVVGPAFLLREAAKQHGWKRVEQLSGVVGWTAVGVSAIVGAVATAGYARTHLRTPTTATEHEEN